MRNHGAMLGDPNVREGYVQGAVARGMEAAGSNANGSMAGFMGMGVGMQAGGGFMGAASQFNQQQMAANRAAAQAVLPVPDAEGWKCGCGAVNTGKFYSECGKPKPEDNSWVCSCGSKNSGKFCPECGKAKPDSTQIKCDKCGYEPDMSLPIPKFCPECGDPIGPEDRK